MPQAPAFTLSLSLIFLNLFPLYTSAAILLPPVPPNNDIPLAFSPTAPLTTTTNNISANPPRSNPLRPPLPAPHRPRQPPHLPTHHRSPAQLPEYQHAALVQALQRPGASHQDHEYGLRHQSRSQTARGGNYHLAWTNCAERENDSVVVQCAWGGWVAVCGPAVSGLDRGC